jgi:hypothetical protein
LIPGNSYRELRPGRRSIANCWSPTIERWRLSRRRLAEGGLSVKRLAILE